MIFLLLFLIKLATEVFVGGMQPGAFLLSPCSLVLASWWTSLHEEKPVQISVPNTRPPRQCEGTFASAAPRLWHVDGWLGDARKKVCAGMNETKAEGFGLVFVLVWFFYPHI